MISTKHRPWLGFHLALQSLIRMSGNTSTHTLTEAQGCFPFQNSCWPLLVGAFHQCAFSSVFIMFLCCQSTSSLSNCECCLNFTNLMLYKLRSSSQFNMVFSSCFGIQALTDTLLPMHGGETIPNYTKTTQKCNSALCHQGSRLRLLRGKGLYFRKCKQGNQCCKNCTAIAGKSK